MNGICVFSNYWGLLLKRISFISIITFVLVLILFQSACINPTTEKDEESLHSEEPQGQTPTHSHTMVPGTSSSLEPIEPVPTFTPDATSSQEIAASTSEVGNSLTESPSLLIAGIEVKQKGEIDEFHEIWLIDTQTEKKQQIFTTNPGTRLSTMMWGDEQSSILYVAEIKGIGEGAITWQLYEVNYETGETRTFFGEPVEGMPRLLDISNQGKWLRVWVDFFAPLSFEWWFINTEDGTVIKNDQDDPYLSGFVWSPDEPDSFAYYQESTVEDDIQFPQSIVFSEVTNNFEAIDIIEHEYKNLGSEPLLMWDLSTPKEIIVLTPGETYIVDIIQRNWEQLAQRMDVFPGDGFTKLVKSPSRQWAVTTTFIRTIQLSTEPIVIERFEDKVGQGHKFLSWYNNEDWMVIRTREGYIQVYKLDDPSVLIDEINLNNYGFTSPREYTILAKPLN